MNPSWQVTKLMLAYGFRPLWAYRSLDPESRVAKLQAEARSYALLGGLNTRPRTTYLAAVRNVNPELG